MTPSLHGSDAGSDEDYGGDGGLDDAGTGSDFELRQADSDSEIDTVSCHEIKALIDMLTLYTSY